MEIEKRNKQLKIEQDARMAEYSKKDIESRTKIYEGFEKFYADTRDKIAKGEIPTMPDIGQAIIAPVEIFKDDKEKAIARKALRGLNVKRKKVEEAEKRANLEISQKNIMPLFLNFVTDLESVISANSQENTFGGPIEIEFLVKKEDLPKQTLVQLEKTNSELKIAKISFPSGLEWEISIHRGQSLGISILSNDRITKGRFNYISKKKQFAYDGTNGNGEMEYGSLSDFKEAINWLLFEQIQNIPDNN